MSRVVYVLAAGVGVPLGLPTATFAKGDGQPIARALRVTAAARPRADSRCRPPHRST